MTSPISSSNSPFSSSLNSATGNRSTKSRNPTETPEAPSNRQETVRPTLPTGPLGQNVNTTA